MAQKILKNEYKKQVARIKKAIIRQEKRGFNLKDFKLPKPPKKITQASINRLKKITPQKLREFADNHTNKSVKIGYEGTNIDLVPNFDVENQSEDINDYPNEGEIILDNLREMLESNDRSVGGYLSMLLEDRLYENYDETINSISLASDDLISLAQSIQYASGAEQEARSAQRLLSIIQAGKQTFDQSAMIERLSAMDFGAIK